MARCNQCIHFSLCEYNTDISTEKAKIFLRYKDGAERCTFFKDRNLFLEYLPICVGTPVYVICEYKLEIKECRISMMQQKADRTWKIRVSFPGGGVKDYPMNDIDKKIFLTYEDAERVLKPYLRSE